MPRRLDPNWDTIAPAWRHRAVSSLTLASCAVGFAGVCWLVAVVVGGCAVGYPLRDDGTADTGDAIIGISTGTANAAGAGLLSLGGLLSGNPAIVGLAALVAHQFGARKGWDEKADDDLKARGIVATKE